MSNRNNSVKCLGCFILTAMVEDTRLLRVEADSPLGQFVEESVERTLEDDGRDVRVTELDPNMVPDRLLNSEL